MCLTHIIDSDGADSILINSKKENFNEPVNKKDKSRRSSFLLTSKSADGE